MLPHIKKMFIAFTCLCLVSCHVKRHVAKDGSMREVTEYLVTVRYNVGGNEGLVLRTIGAISPIRMVYEVTTSNLEKEIQVSCYCSSKEKLDELEQELRATGVVNSVSIRRL